MRAELETTLRKLITNYDQLSTKQRLDIVIHGKYTGNDAAGLATAVAVAVQKYIKTRGVSKFKTSLGWQNKHGKCKKICKTSQIQVDTY